MEDGRVLIMNKEGRCWLRDDKVKVWMDVGDGDWQGSNFQSRLGLGVDEAEGKTLHSIQNEAKRASTGAALPSSLLSLDGKARTMHTIAHLEVSPVTSPSSEASIVCVVPCLTLLFCAVLFIGTTGVCTSVRQHLGVSALVADVHSESAPTHRPHIQSTGSPLCGFIVADSLWPLLPLVQIWWASSTQATLRSTSRHPPPPRHLSSV
jgi:hypothetical protein